ERMRRQTEMWGCDIREMEAVKKIAKEGKKFRVVTGRGEYLASAVIIATGRERRRLSVPGEEEFKGRGVSYCATCDAPLYRGKRVLVVGGGNTAASEALCLSESAREVHLVHRRDDLRAEMAVKEKLKERGVIFHWSSVVKGIEGDEVVRRVVIQNLKSGEEKALEVDGVFIAVGEAPSSALAAELGVRLDEEGYVVVNRNQMTNVEGVFAAGDVTGGVMQIVTAAGEGATAAVNAYLYIRGGWYGEGAGSSQVRQ
ncbi:MAG: FAD-dependent oxidoreductase, partial [Candidatus Freyarchaeota archaeon]|nr:FAD-dependent oxidoreductase [Candidatus Jordarchaeia archaeon]